MPTYEYACSDCGHEMEIFQSIRDERLTKCPACEKDGLKRLIGRGAGIIFKGSGFYETDYKGGSSAKTDGGNSGGGEGGSAPSAPAAPAASTAPAPSSNP